MKKVLFICNDNELTRSVKQCLDNLKITVIPAQSHLQAITIMDKTHVDVIIAPAYETNMNGLEFVKFLCTKKDNYVVPKKYFILYGDEESRDEVLSSNLPVDDFLLYPFYELELIWRTKKGFNYISEIQCLFQKLSIDTTTNTLTPNGFYIVLESEINRISRHTRNLSLLLITISNLYEILLNFGKEWQEWLEKKFLVHLKNNLRSYDQLSKLDTNMFVILVPDADYNSLKGLDKRLKREYKFFFSELKNLKFGEELKIVHRGISIEIFQDTNKKDEVLSYVKQWLTKKKSEDVLKDEFMVCSFSEFGHEVEYR